MVNEKVLDLANKISRVKRGSKLEIKPEYPEYRILEPVVTTEMAEAALCLEFRVPRSAEEVAAQCGKPAYQTVKLLWELAVAGVAFVNKIDGVDKYWHDIWVPGHMEMMANHPDTRYVPKLKHEYGKKIAVIGAGPSGLSCAYYLAVDGYKVTVFEKQKALGGMLTLGISSFRLEKNVINAEIDILRELGVEFITDVEVGKDVSLKELRDRGFEAFYIAIGAQAGRKIGIEGEDSKGVKIQNP